MIPFLLQQTSLDDAEFVLLINDDQPQPLEFDGFLDHGMSSDDELDLSCPNLAVDLLPLLTFMLLVRAT
jgi:hypothetical protein